MVLRVDPEPGSDATYPRSKRRRCLEFDRLADSGKPFKGKPYAYYPSKANWHRSHHRRYGNMDGDMGANPTHADVSLWARDMDLSAARMD